MTRQDRPFQAPDEESVAFLVSETLQIFCCHSWGKGPKTVCVAFVADFSKVMDMRVRVYRKPEILRYKRYK